MTGKHPTYVLIHSPLVGPLTWSLVAGEMNRNGLQVLVPRLVDSPGSGEPFWKQHAGSVSQALAEIPSDVPVSLVAHSGAGPLLPAIRQSIPHSIATYIFVDAGIPRAGATRLELMKSEDAEWGRQFQEYLEAGGRFPDWSSEDLREILPDPQLRQQMVAEIQPRTLEFFDEPIPVFEGWPDVPCVYVLFSDPYVGTATQAQQGGWIVDEIRAGHFHMLVDPDAVASKIIETVKKARKE